jgi:predicted N-acyltransferase
MPDSSQILVLESLAQVNAAEWNALVSTCAADQPFLRHEFLHALHETGCASEASGWLPQFLTLWRDGRLAAAMPLYLKEHSRGEYVFDWAWADAYHQHGLAYYPKLLSAVPFSPIGGSRLLARTKNDQAELARAALQLARQVSSLHVLFAPDSEMQILRAAGMMLRHGVQFHWLNEGYGSFEAFLGDLSSSKRKKIRQERRRVAESGATFRRLVGRDISDEHWKFFARCYNSTYREHHSSPYLNLAFFRRLGETMPDNLLLVVAELDGRLVASSLNIFSSTTLYGRYWGAVSHIPLLHFEACYYQTLEFCIERGIAVFEGGAQGEHKLARGFRPVQTASAHWLRHPQFADAVQRFLDKETAGMESYMDELNDRMPFRKSDAGHGVG